VALLEKVRPTPTATADEPSAATERAEHPDEASEPPFGVAAAEGTAAADSGS
jgi:hypothetical protein